MALSAAVMAGGQAGRPAAPYQVPRTPDGHPDMQGVWANNNMTPLERPAQFGLRATMTDAEFAQVKKNLSSMMDGGDAFFADELITAAVDGKTKFSSADTQTGNYGRRGCRSASSTTARRSSSIRPTAAFRRSRPAPPSARGPRRPPPPERDPPTARRICRSAHAASATARRTSAPAIRAISKSPKGRTWSPCAPR